MQICSDADEATANGFDGPPQEIAHGNIDEHQVTSGPGVTPRLECPLALGSQDAVDAKQSSSAEDNEKLEQAEQRPDATLTLGSGGRGLTVGSKDGIAPVDDDLKDRPRCANIDRLRHHRQVPEDLSRTSWEELLGWPSNCMSPDAGDAGGYALVQLPVSGASSLVIPGPSVLRTLPLGASLEQLMLEPRSIPRPSKTKAQRETGHAWNLVRGLLGATSNFKRTKRRNKDEVSDNLPPPVEDDDFIVYRRNVDYFAGKLSIYDNVAYLGTRHLWSCRIMINDLLKPTWSEPQTLQELWEGYETAPPFEDFCRRLTTVTPNCVQRLVLVEDLASPTIHMLGATFKIPPNVFEHHLTGSGYNRSQSDNSSATTWASQSSVQGYCSITWYRPVIPLIPLSARLRTKLIRNREPPIVQCVSADCDSHVPHHVCLNTTTNIWRKNLELSPEPASYENGSRVDYPVGWEDRATIWMQVIEGCRFG